ncbi:glycosyltransferase family 2 protein [Vibrio sp. PNB23_22_6]
MKVHVYLLCYNESEIIESVIRYYEQFCSKIFILDNYSTDNSVEIAKKFSKVTVIPWSSGGKIDQKLYVKLKSTTFKSYSRVGGQYTTEVADFVICCDMDEILYHPNILEVLSKYKDEGVTVPHITGFNMYGENTVSPYKPIFDQYVYGARAVGFDKRIVFSSDFDMSYSVGCHPKGVGFEYMKNTYGYKASNKYPLALLHYKWIGTRQMSTALKNVDRLPVGQVKKVGKRYIGLGAHYQAIVDGAIVVNKIDTRVIDDNGVVLFENFLPTTGEAGMNSSRATIFQEDVDVLRDLAISCENDKLEDSYKLMKIAHKARPDGPFIRQKINEYETKLKIL